MRYVWLCLFACVPVFAADVQIQATPSAKAVAHPHSLAPSKPGRLISPEDYDFDHLLRCAVGCWG